MNIPEPSLTMGYRFLFICASLIIFSCAGNRSQTKETHLVRENNPTPGQNKKISDPVFYPERPLPDDIIEKEKPAIARAEKKPAKKNKEPGVTYSGNEFIQENTVHPLVGKKTVVLTIKGNGRIQRGTTQLSGHIIHVIGKNGEYAETPSSVHVYDSKEKLNIIAGYSLFKKTDKVVLLTRSPIARQKDKKGNMEIRAHQMSWDLEKRELRAMGNVIILTPDYQMECDDATWLEKPDIIYLSGNPIIREKKSFYRSEKMTYYRQDKKAELEKDVFFHIMDSPGKLNEDKAKTPQEEVFTKITAHRSIIRHGESARLKREIEFYPDIKSRVRVERESMTLYGQKIIAYGEKPEEIYAWDYVEMDDPENSARLFSHHARYYDDDNDRVIMESRGNPPFLPVIFYYNAQSREVDMILSAHYIERKLEKKETYSRGNVRAMETDQEKIPLFIDDVHPFSPENSEFMEKNSTGLFSEWAKSRDEDKTISFHGGPHLIRDFSRLNAREITYYYEEKRILFHGPLDGQIK